MIKHYCDICGKELPSFDLSKNIFNTVTITNYTNHRSYTQELCDKCINMVEGSLKRVSDSEFYSNMHNINIKEEL